MNTFEFIQGMQDCREGKPHEAGKGDSYDRGYSAQYSFEQLKTEMAKDERR